MVRYNLPIVIVVVNNGGIYGGFDRETFDAIRSDGDLLKVYDIEIVVCLLIDSKILFITTVHLRQH